jgi:phospholipid-binding lipoprotein MlaA
LPADVTDPVVNFADNTALPGMVVNGLLQGDIEGVASNTLRFLLNSTVGIGGLYDPADAIGLFEQSTDFGQTLAVWGVPEGAYRELPLRGPSTERDAAGGIVDIFLDPLGYALDGEQRAVVTGTRVAGKVIDRGRFAQTVDSVLYDSADSYAQARILYLQNRRFELGQGAFSGAIDPYADPCAGGFEDPYADPATDPCAVGPSQ